MLRGGDGVRGRGEGGAREGRGRGEGGERVREGCGERVRAERVRMWGTNVWTPLPAGDWDQTDDGPLPVCVCVCVYVCVCGTKHCVNGEVKGL